MFDNLFELMNSTTPGFSPVAAVTNIILAFGLSLIIALVYKATHKGLSYSQTFVLTLVIAGMVIAAVMMVIGSNVARAFGAFGAFSLLRFRTAIKDVKDMAYLFLVMAVGMAVGSGTYAIAIFLTIFALLVIVVLTKTNFGSIRRFDYVLNFNLDTRQSNEQAYKAVFEKHLKQNTLLNIKAIEQGHVLMLSYSIRFINEASLQEFSGAMSQLNGVSSVNLITAKNDIEY
jgi:uncharacterized membrane protein YhiD involved in acid resistance